MQTMLWSQINHWKGIRSLNLFIVWSSESTQVRAEWEPSESRMRAVSRHTDTANERLCNQWSHQWSDWSPIISKEFKPNIKWLVISENSCAINAINAIIAEFIANILGDSALIWVKTSNGLLVTELKHSIRLWKGSKLIDCPLFA